MLLQGIAVRAGAEPGQVLFTADVRPGVQSSCFMEADVLAAETLPAFVSREMTGITVMGAGREECCGAEAPMQGCSRSLTGYKPWVAFAAVGLGIALFWERIKTAAPALAARAQPAHAPRVLSAAGILLPLLPPGFGSWILCVPLW